MPAPFRLLLARAFQGERSGVDGHADHRVDPQRIERVDFLLRRDAAGRRQRALRRRADGPDGIHVDAAHQAFRIDVGVEEAAADGLEFLHGLHRRERQRGPPAVDDELPALRIDRHDDPIAPHGVTHPGGKGEVGLAVLEDGRAEDDLPGARIDHLPRSLDGPDAASDATAELGGDPPEQVVVGAGAHGRVEVDQLDEGETLESANPPEDVAALDRDPITLDELHDLSTL